MVFSCWLEFIVVQSQLANIGSWNCLKAKPCIAICMALVYEKTAWSVRTQQASLGCGQRYLMIRICCMLHKSKVKKHHARIACYECAILSWLWVFWLTQWHWLGTEQLRELSCRLQPHLLWFWLRRAAAQLLHCGTMIAVAGTGQWGLQVFSKRGTN